MMRSIPNHRLSLLVHSALAGALAFCASPLMAEDQLGNFEIQVVEQGPPAQQPGTAIQSPRDAASGQATGIQSPRDAASGQATGLREGGQNNTTYQSAPGTSTPNNALVNNENVAGARGTATAKPGAGPSQTCISECNNLAEYVRATPQDGAKATAGNRQSTRPARSGPRQRKAKRMHKP